MANVVCFTLSKWTKGKTYSALPSVHFTLSLLYLPQSRLGKVDCSSLHILLYPQSTLPSVCFTLSLLYLPQSRLGKVDCSSLHILLYPQSTIHPKPDWVKWTVLVCIFCFTLSPLYPQSALHSVCFTYPKADWVKWTVLVCIFCFTPQSTIHPKPDWVKWTVLVCIFCFTLSPLYPQSALHSVCFTYPKADWVKWTVLVCIFCFTLSPPYTPNQTG